MQIGDLFARDIRRKIRPVVEVEDRDEVELRSELEEYVVTDQIASHFVRLLEGSYFDRAPRGVGLWISGFFGTGKSLFLKLFALSLAHSRVGESTVTDYLLDGTEDEDFRRSLRALAKRKPAKVIALHMRTDAHERESVVSILWRRLHQEFGYSRIPWIAEIERSLSRRGLLAAFAADVERQQGRPWNEVRLESILQQAVLAKGLLAIDPTTYPDLPAAERAVRDARDQEEDLLTVARFTSRCLELLGENPEYERLFFALDEMGQFAANEPALLLELQAIVEKFLSEGRGKLWLAATAQERLDQVVENFAQHQDDVNKIRDRFVKELRVELTAENAERIVLDRLLKKPSEKLKALEQAIGPEAAWIEHETVLADTNVELRPSKIDDVLESYPFIPSQFRLITLFMQGLAHDTGGTADRTAKGARALIGVTQEIAAGLADHSLGEVVSLDRVYSAMEGAIPTEDVEVVRALDSESRRPPRASEILRIDYILDQIGDRHVQATRGNLVRASWPKLGAAVGPVQSEVEEAIQYLIAHAYVRETGGGGKTTYRFLRAYQRKIEDEVRSYYVDSSKLATRTRAILKDVLESVGIAGTKVPYRGARSFTLVPSIDGEFISADGRLKVDIWSPLHARGADPKVESVTKHSVIWASAERRDFEDEVRGLVATSAVLTTRREKATTQAEDEQIRRAQSDLEFRETRVRENAERALFDGLLFVYGASVPATANVASGVVEAIVAADYPGLADAPYGVTEADVSAIFGAPLPKEGASVKLGLVDGGALSDHSAIASHLLAVIEQLHFRGGATGKGVLEKMGQSPYGYGEMQTILAACALWKLGTIRALVSAGIELGRDALGERRMSRIADFRALAFERERIIDDGKLKAASALLQQFDRVGVVELPRIAREARSVATEIRDRIKLVLAQVRDDVPQVETYVADLREAADQSLLAEGDVATVEAFLGSAEAFRGAKRTLEPLGKLDREAIADFAASRRLLESHAVNDGQPDVVSRLRGFLDGPRPWIDLAQIRQCRSEIVGLIRTKLRNAHDARDEAVREGDAELRARAADRCIANDVLEVSLHRLDPCRCSSFQPRDDGSCGTCHKSIDALEDQLLAFPGYMMEARRIQLSPARDTTNAGGSDQHGRKDKGEQTRGPAMLSVRTRVQLPRLLDSAEGVNAFLFELRTVIEGDLETYGSVEVGP